jgi:hypothetical protein
MKFTCLFAHEDRRHEELTIAVELTADEVKAIRALCREGDEHWEVKSRAYALRHAYRMAPQGFVHIGGGVRQVMVH